jgi:glycosyltransferase involved in cell wall biosynthesis
VIGDGPEHKKLQALAGPSVTFLTTVTDQQMPKYFQNARAFIFPGLDDFGITPVEAMAAGTPVIAYKAGGALDYVVPGKTGEFFEKQTADSLKQALKLFKPERFNPKQIATHAHKFDPKVFGDKLIKLIESTAK